ncbi:MAG TPA: DUF302 domain-containing protein [Thermoanaerobaculia bacterium]|nr:DUF302 domain-containing protein [Thermoanaerobaculia bacterium]
MSTTTRYGIRKVVAMPYAEAVQRVTEVLKEQGFGVLSEIDIRAKLKEKLDVDVPNYIILGACNPPLAHKALQAEPEIGLLLPCNVIVYERDGQTIVSAVDPDAMLGIVSNPAVAEVAADAKKRLQAAMEKL